LTRRRPRFFDESDHDPKAFVGTANRCVIALVGNAPHGFLGAEARALAGISHPDAGSAALLTQTVAVAVVIIIGVATAVVAPQAIIAAAPANYDAAVDINATTAGCDVVVAVSVATKMTAAGCDVAANVATKVAAAVTAAMAATVAATTSHCAG
jgi:hypothetical protein